jgi:PTS system nitrogen regulatory IIA component
MIPLIDTIAPNGVLLHAKSVSLAAAVAEVAAPLRTDPRVIHWEKLFGGMRKMPTCLADCDGDFALCIPHAKTDAVLTMVMSIGRFDAGLTVPDCPQPVRYLFCIAVPTTHDSDYLRIVGLLARMLNDRSTEALLRAAETPEEFIATLARLEAKL